MADTEREQQIAAVMALADIYAAAYYRWHGTGSEYRTMVETRARLYDGVAAALSTGGLQESPQASPHAYPVGEESPRAGAAATVEAAHSEADCDFLRGVTNEVCDQHCAGVAPSQAPSALERAIAYIERWAPTINGKIISEAAEVVAELRALTSGVRVDASIKEHVVRETVNAATKVAREFHATQQLRCRMVDALTPLIKAARGVLVPAEIDRDTDGELLIDWSPGPGRMVTLSLRADGRLSYAITWDGEKTHGKAQMPAGVDAPDVHAQPIGFVTPDLVIPGRFIYVNFFETRNSALEWHPVYLPAGVKEGGNG